MFQLILLIIVLATRCMSHTYTAGLCPYIEPIKDFDMARFLGRWYALQKTTTDSSCLTYDFKEDTKEGNYLLEQTSERYQTNLNASYIFNYTGKITTNNNKSSKMTIRFPLNIAGSASFNVITTDYKTHAAIYTCQNLLFVKRQSATLLSRTRKIDESVLKKMRLMFDENIVDLSLRTIRHDMCYEAENQVLVKIKSNLISSVNLIRKVPHLINNVNEKIDERIAYESSYKPEFVEHDENSGENTIQPRIGIDDQEQF